MKSVNVPAIHTPLSSEHGTYKTVKILSVAFSLKSFKSFRENNLQYFKDFYLRAKARIWPWLSCMCHVRSAGMSGALMSKHL